MRKLLIILPFFLCGLSWSQTNEERQKIIEKRIEFIGENLEDSELDLTTYFDELYYFMDNPINLNETHFEELGRLHLLTDVQMQSIINYRLKYGDFITLYELGAIEELDAQIIDMIMPFVDVQKVEKDDFKWKNSIKYGKHEIISRYERVLEQKAGYIEQTDSVLAVNPNKQYLGSPDKFYLRYRNQYKDRLSWGVTMEKDPGEELFVGSQKRGFDYYSAHLFLKKLWKFKAVAIGDYQVNFGQGLTVWSGFALGKSADVMSAKRYGYGLRPYTSVNESRFMRGAGINFGNDKIDATVFGSYKGLDANINAIDTNAIDFIDNSFSSFQTSGYHRLQSEIDDRKAVQEAIVGGEVAYKGDKMRIGLSSVYTNYDQPLVPNSAAYKEHKFASDQLLTTGLNYRYFFRKVSFFGETAVSDNAKWATVNGLSWHVDPRLDLIMLYRNYDKGFQSLYSASFGETSDNAGEMGIYFGLQARISKRINISAYYDQFNYTYLKYLTDDYSEGREIFAQFDMKLNRRSKFYFRFRNKVTQRNSRDEVTGLKPQVNLNKTNLRFHYEQQINYRLTLKSRIEWVNYLYDDDKSNGLLLFQDVVYQFQKIPLKVYGRYALYDSDNYDSRIYAYENDLLYVFSIPSYFYRGMRTYLMLKYDLGDKIDIWVRYGLWSYQNRDVISSGLEQIDGNRKSDLKIQLKIRL